MHEFLLHVVVAGVNLIDTALDSNQPTLYVGRPRNNLTVAQAFPRSLCRFAYMFKFLDMESTTCASRLEEAAPISALDAKRQTIDAVDLLKKMRRKSYRPSSPVQTFEFTTSTESLIHSFAVVNAILIVARAAAISAVSNRELNKRGLTMSNATLAFSSAGSATVADLSRDLRDLGQVVDALQRAMKNYPNLERELEHMREGNQNLLNREIAIIKELEGLRLEMKELRAQQAEIMQRENNMKDKITDLRKGHREVHARQDEMKREIMRIAGC
ncbi:hypothetical protein R1sor_012314 [Riccia sorocarpa]|uniref:Uncharacterized protein n=1 Tax=Riccia sorocarpa TaxID=122646 RepID=A0ABD3I3F4_9MARC